MEVRWCVPCKQVWGAGMYGAARSAKLVGNNAKARHYYTQLVELTKNGDASRADIKEARSAAAKLADR